MDDKDLERLKKEALSILIDFDQICKENNLTYYLSDGTLIGAIRHEGFIPWDDDIDLTMPREDYTKLLKEQEKLLDQNKYWLQTIDNDKTYTNIFSKIRKKNTTISKNNKEEVFIDVFPLDKITDNKFLAYICILRVTYLKLVMACKMKRAPYNKTLKRNIPIAIIDFLSHFHNLDRCKKKAQLLATKYNNTNALHRRSSGASFMFKNYFPKEYFAKTVKCNFEGYKFSTMVGYDKYLRQCYGNYMELPKKESRVPLHAAIKAPEKKKKTKQDLLISIIIPIYNAEKYLKECIDSILKQTYKNFELILVNDGSTDSSLKIIKSFKDSRIKLIDRENKGAAYSRIEGTKKATGEYLMYVDADDFLDKDTLEIYASEIAENNYEYLRGNYKKIDDDKNITLVNDFSKETAIKKINLEDEIICNMAKSDKYNSVWREIVKKDLIDTKSIDSKIFMGDDMLFNYFLYKNIKNGKLITDYLYNYRVNSSSITNTKNIEKTIKNTDDVIKANKIIIKDVEKNYSHDTIKEWYKRFVRQVNHSLYRIFRNTNDKKIREEQIELLFNDELIKKIQKELTTKDFSFVEGVFCRHILKNNSKKYYYIMNMFSKVYKK